MGHHAGIPQQLTPAQAAKVVGLTLGTLNFYRRSDRPGAGPTPTVVGGGQRARVEYTWEALNAWLRARGRPEVEPHCPCCGRP